jgi:hypothetical protein
MALFVVFVHFASPGLYKWEKVCNTYLCGTGLFPLNMMVSGSIHFPANGITPFFKCLSKIQLCVCIAHFLYPFIFWWVSRLTQNLAVVNSSAINMGIQISL